MGQTHRGKARCGAHHRLGHDGENRRGERAQIIFAGVTSRAMSNIAHQQHNE